MSPKRHALVVIGLAFGDCGKGTTVDFLSRRHAVHTVVRFNGGPQAGHNVVTPDGRHHTFAQFGSGSFVPGVATVLSRFVLIEPYAVLNEAAALERAGVSEPLARLSIHRGCPVVTPAQQAANHLRELARGASAHGTCGMGVGETVGDSLSDSAVILRAGELSQRSVVARKLRGIRDLKLAQMGEAARTLAGHPRARRAIETLLHPSWIEVALDCYVELARQCQIISDDTVRDVLSRDGAVIFEGAQGVLLDESAGFHPHTTWSNTTFANAGRILDEIQYQGDVTRLGVLRTYLTRHGAGPLATERAELRAAVPECHNGDGGWAGAFRVGVFDAVAARYAITAAGAGLDGLVLTHMDRLNVLPRDIAVAYQYSDGSIRRELCRPLIQQSRPVFQQWRDTHDFVATVEDQLGVGVAITSSGPRANQKTVRAPRL